MNKQDINIKELIRIFDKSSMTKLKISEGDFCVELKKDCSTRTYNNAEEVQVPVIQTIQPQALTHSSKSTEEQTSKSGDSSLPTFKSPMVGTFYKAPSPAAEAFVQIGSIVKKGQPVAIVEAMKIMNEIDAEFDCRIIDILVEDGQPVEFNMPLFSVEKI